jgi:hypothetical protein
VGVLQAPAVLATNQTLGALAYSSACNRFSMAVRVRSTALRAPSLPAYRFRVGQVARPARGASDDVWQ